MTRLLDGMRVLDLTRVLAGPWATQTLADLGATVIKVEKPGQGDDTRGWGPPFIRDADGDPVVGLSAYFACANRGKYSAAIDIAHPDGQDLLRHIVRDCDVVVENFKVGGLKRYRLDYESLKPLNPKLVYCSITGFGQSGLYAHRVGYDVMVQGLGGLMSITGLPDNVPGGGPMKVGVAVTDLLTGLYATIAILAALPHARATGIGQHIDISLLDVQVAALANQALNYLASGVSPTRLGNAHPTIVPYQAFETADRPIMLTVGNDWQFQKLCLVLGQQEMAQDPRFTTNPARVAHRGELCKRIEDVLLAQKASFWLERLENEGVPAGPINEIADVFCDPHVVERGLKMELSAKGASVPTIASPLRFSATPVSHQIPPPHLGEHTEAVLCNMFSIPPETYLRLKAAKVIA